MVNAVAVKFVSLCTPYNAGEIACFPPAYAKSLIDRGVAVVVETKSVEHSPNKMVKAAAVTK